MQASSISLTVVSLQDHRTPLQNALASPATVAAIIEALPRLEPKDKQKALENEDKVGATALISAGKLSAYTGRRRLGAAASRAGQLKGGRVCVTTYRLHRLHRVYAAAAGNLEVMTLLVGAGANVNAVNKKGITAL